MGGKVSLGHAEGDEKWPHKMQGTSQRIRLVMHGVACSLFRLTIAENPASVWYSFFHCQCNLKAHFVFSFY